MIHDEMNFFADCQNVLQTKKQTKHQKDNSLLINVFAVVTGDISVIVADLCYYLQVTDIHVRSNMEMLP